MNIVLIQILIDLLIVVTFWTIVVWFKNENTYKNHIIITKAIYNYKIALIENGILEEGLVDYDDMRGYEATLFRFWDWGYKNILPKDKFEIIKPYIKEEAK